MKTVAYLLICVVSLASCAISEQVRSGMGKSPIAVQPYIQLKDKERISSDTLEDRQDSLIVPGRSFAKKDVAFYSDGNTTFANVCIPCQSPYTYKFAPRIIEGNLNFYQASWPTHDKSGRLRHDLQNFMEQKGSGQLLVYRYYNLKDIILPGKPGYGYLHHYGCRAWRKPLGILGGLAVEFTGVGIIGNAGNQRSDITLAAGDVLMVAGICGVLASAIFLDADKGGNMARAVAAYNSAQ